MNQRAKNLPFPRDKGKHIKRILFYTHNSVGLGHAFRTLAVITGMRRWLPGTEFMVLSGTSVPQIFFEEGIEVIRLPSVRLCVDSPGHELQPRYLRGFSTDEVFDFRRRIIMDAYDFFSPDVFMVEHKMGGLMNEVVPVLLKRLQIQPQDKKVVLSHLSRGIIGPIPRISFSTGNADEPEAPLSVAHLYDSIYVLEDRTTVDVHKEYCGGEDGLEEKIRYLGRITSRALPELADPDKVLRCHRLTGKRVILMNLCRHGPVVELTISLLAAFERAGLADGHQIVVVLDPYLDRETHREQRAACLSRGALVLPFVPQLVNLMNAADLVICRAGYNMVNEVLMTGVRALIIPEHHPSAEQERRAGLISSDHVMVACTEEILHCRPETMLLELLSRNRGPARSDFDKYAVGRRIADDLEARFLGADHAGR
ncbi:MAG: glycosyltransferase [Syntrophobacteraceae bacterium]